MASAFQNVQVEAMVWTGRNGKSITDPMDINRWNQHERLIRSGGAWLPHLRLGIGTGQFGPVLSQYQRETAVADATQ